METITTWVNEFEHEDDGESLNQNIATNLGNQALNCLQSRSTPNPASESPLHIRYEDGSELHYIVIYTAHNS